jgi:curved DNA-binding protein CbpA
MDPYKVLQVDPEAEDEVIQAAYRRLAQKYHPDVAGPDGSARMAAINAAWELLRDPKRRAGVDRERRIARHAAEGAHQAQTAAGARSAGSSTPPPASPSAARGGAAASAGAGPRPAETVSSDWSSGRSTAGGGYDPSRMRAPEGLGAAGPPPGDASGTVLSFGRYAGWSLGEIARRDVDYVEWLDRMPIGRPYRDEIDGLLRKAGRRRSAATEAQDRRGLFRR